MRGNDGGESHLQSHYQEQPMGGGRCRLVVEVVLSGRHTAGRAAVNLPAHPGRAPATYLRAHIPMRSRIDTPPACSIPRQRQQARTTRRTARADVVVRRQGQMWRRSLPRCTRQLGRGGPARCLRNSGRLLELAALGSQRLRPNRRKRPKRAARGVRTEGTEGVL